MRMVTTQQDLFSQRMDVAVLPPPARKVARNARAAKPTTRKAGTTDHTILQAIKAAGVLGRTRRELDDLTDLGTATISWALDRLESAGQIFRRIDTKRKDQSFGWVSRQRNYVVYASIHAGVFAAGDCPPYIKPRKEEAPARG